MVRDNLPQQFWKLLDGPEDKETWSTAAELAVDELGTLPATEQKVIPNLANAILHERQFGPAHWQLSKARRAYYHLRPFLPARARLLLHKVAGNSGRKGFPLRWPIEDRYVRFQFKLVRNVMLLAGTDSMRFVHFWPGAKRFAFVLTHDVESQVGHDFVRELVEIEERHGFRSSFNFVPEVYDVDSRLLCELGERGFEVGVHGLKHDGRMFSSRTSFERCVPAINGYLQSWNATGFRSPMTHRQPEWMQALNVEYDASFFDTDPYEPLPGGTMSLWPFFMGHFVELPYTLPQDHTLMITLGEQTPKIWLDKVDFIRRNCGMALSLTHPDYLREPRRLAIYDEFLNAMVARNDYWHALPREAARWWRVRNEISTPVELDGASTGMVRSTGSETVLFPSADEVILAA